MSKQTWLAYYRYPRIYLDHRRPDKYLAIRLGVPCPRAVEDLPTILIRLSNGPRATILNAAASMSDVGRLLAELPPPADRERLEAALREAAHRHLELMQADRLGQIARQGVPLYRGDTGERVTEPKCV